MQRLRRQDSLKKRANPLKGTSVREQRSLLSVVPMICDLIRQRTEPAAANAFLEKPSPKLDNEVSLDACLARSRASIESETLTMDHQNDFW